MHCREILFTPRCRPRATEYLRSVNFSLRRTVAELRGVKVAQLSDFGIFSLYKTLKTYLLVTSLQPRVTSQNDYDLSCGSRSSKGVPFRIGDFLRLLVGQLGTPNVPKYRILLHGASDLDQRCLKTRNSDDECTFPPNIFIPTHKNYPKTPFWGTLQCETYYTESPPSVAYVNGTTTLKPYGYIGIGKYFLVCQNFSVWGKGPLM